jgi:hypothetical protein
MKAKLEENPCGSKVWQDASIDLTSPEHPEYNHRKCESLFVVGT